MPCHAMLVCDCVPVCVLLCRSLVLLTAAGERATVCWSWQTKTWCPAQRTTCSAWPRYFTSQVGGGNLTPLLRHCQLAGMCMTACLVSLCTHMCGCQACIGLEPACGPLARFGHCKPPVHSQTSRAYSSLSAEHITALAQCDE